MPCPPGFGLIRSRAGGRDGGGPVAGGNRSSGWRSRCATRARDGGCRPGALAGEDVGLTCTFGQDFEVGLVLMKGGRAHVLARIVRRM